MPCDCRSNARRLAILARGLDEYPELVEFGSMPGWTLHRELVTKAPRSRFHRGICASLAGLGQEQGELVLAEGVETEAEWRVMEELGVNLLQGFLFGRPDPVPAVTARVAAKRGVRLGGDAMARAGSVGTEAS
jgi:predicted signal transduction protein with EAL and GGDEF domain